MGALEVGLCRKHPRSPSTRGADALPYFVALRQTVIFAEKLRLVFFLSTEAAERARKRLSGEVRRVPGKPFLDCGGETKNSEPMFCKVVIALIVARAEGMLTASYKIL